MIAEYDGIEVCYDNGKTYRGYVEKIRTIGDRTLVTIAVPVRDRDCDGYPLTGYDYRSVYLDKCVSFGIIESVYN